MTDPHVVAGSQAVGLTTIAKIETSKNDDVRQEFVPLTTLKKV
jgi:hypothetical protein